MDKKLNVLRYVIFGLAFGIGFSSFPENISARQILNTQILSARSIEQLGNDYMLEHYPLSDEDTKITMANGEKNKISLIKPIILLHNVHKPTTALDL